MSRDPGRIDPMVTMLYRLWMRSPDLRLAQLIGNLAGTTDDPYHVEDNVIEDAMRRQIEDLGLPDIPMNDQADLQALSDAASGLTHREAMETIFERFFNRSPDHGYSFAEFKADALTILDAASPGPDTDAGLDVAVLRRAASAVNDMDPADYLDRGDFIDALAAEYVRLVEAEPDPHPDVDLFGGDPFETGELNLADGRVR